MGLVVVGGGGGILYFYSKTLKTNAKIRAILRTKTPTIFFNSNAKNIATFGIIVIAGIQPLVQVSINI